MRKVFAELDPVCANASGFIGIIAAATIIIAAKVIDSFTVVCRVIINIYQKCFMTW